MSKIKSEQELRELFGTQFDHSTTLCFEEWLDEKLELGEVEICEFDHYDCGNLDYKPAAKLIGANGNIFNLMGIAKGVLIDEGKEKESKEMCNKIMNTAKNYDEALLIIMEYVEVE